MHLASFVTFRMEYARCTTRPLMIHVWAVHVKLKARSFRSKSRQLMRDISRGAVVILTCVHLIGVVPAAIRFTILAPGNTTQDLWSYSTYVTHGSSRLVLALTTQIRLHLLTVLLNTAACYTGVLIGRPTPITLHTRYTVYL